MKQLLKNLRPLWIALLIAGSGTCVMVYFLLVSITNGSLLAEGRILMDMPWGLMSLIDVYVGLILFSCWVCWREQNIYAAVLWTLGLLLLGNLVSCLYVLTAIYQAEGRIEKFIYGNYPNQIT